MPPARRRGRGGDGDRGHVLPLLRLPERRAAARARRRARPEGRGAGALDAGGQGTFQAVVGNRVVATSRQPVALTTTGVAIVSTIVRTTMGIPQPWQSDAHRAAAAARSRCGRVSSGGTRLSPEAEVGKRPTAAQEHVADVGRVEPSAAEAVDVRIELGRSSPRSAAATSAKSGGRPPGESARSRAATLSTPRS
jgi:hypothetical protein